MRGFLKTLPVRQPTQLDLAYLAGVIDSDAITRSVPQGVQRNFRHRLMVQITQITTPAIDLAQEVFGGKQHWTEADGVERKIRICRWWIEDQHAADALALLQPFFRIKPLQSLIAREFRATHVMHNPLRPEDIALRDGFYWALREAKEGGAGKGALRVGWNGGDVLPCLT